MATAFSRISAPASAPAIADANAQPLDTTVRLITPERIVFQYPLAGPFRRVFAYLIDQLVILGLLITALIAALVLSLGGSGSGIGLLMVAYFALNWGYRIVLEALCNGQTLGKRVLSIRVMSDKGVSITGAQAVIRNLIGTIDDWYPFAYSVGLASMVLTRKFQRLGDLAAGTMVVVEDRPWRGGVVRVQEKAVDDLLPWLPLRIAAGPELARALSDYVKRRARFGAALREEMAAPLARPLRERLGLPPDSTGDAVLCAVYHRVFVGE